MIAETTIGETTIAEMSGANGDSASAPPHIDVTSHPVQTGTTIELAANGDATSNGVQHQEVGDLRT